jgi:hypothetical protein
MFLDLNRLNEDLDLIENIEKAAMRFVTIALFNFKNDAIEIFRNENDKPADIAEDITREALDNIGISKFPFRIFGKTDYKRACYFFHENYSVRQALLVDSKAEKASNAIRIQMSQLSMTVKQIRQEESIQVVGTLPTIFNIRGFDFLTTTIFVKYIYDDEHAFNELKMIRIACVPNGILQNRYNPTSQDTIWIVGPDSPSRREEFRTRLSFSMLKQKCSWRVQNIPTQTGRDFVWDD